MSLISWIVLISGIINLWVIILLGKRVRLVLVTVSSWWFLWLFLSTFSLTGLFIPEDTTYYLFITMILSITLGALAYMLINNINRRNKSPNYLVTKALIRPKSSWLKNIYLANYCLVLPANLFIFIKALSIFISNPLIISQGYRRDVFFENILFPNPQIQLLYGIIVSPLAFTSLFIGSAIYALRKKSGLLILASAELLMNAIAMAGRFNIYIAVVTFLMAMAIYYYYTNKFQYLFISIIKIIKAHKKLIIGIILLFIIIINISFARSGSEEKNLEDIINQSIIEYHTLGFSIFDGELNSSQSLLNQDRTFGLASSGIFEKILVLLLRRFDKNIDGISGQVGINLNEFRLVGYKNNGEAMMYNAFGTVLYSIYMDGGLIFTLLLPSIYGFYLAKFSMLTSKNMTIYNLSFLLALIYLGIFGIFQPLLTGQYWLYLIYIKTLVPLNAEK
jgi:oligosaccharide repeat unit polymerase